MSHSLQFAAFCLAAASLGAQTPVAQPEAAKPALAPGLYATMTTTMGAIKLRLFENETPITVRNFVNLQLGRKAWKDPKTGQMVRQPHYTGTTFHRVIPGFMIQGGDPAGNGTGDAGFTIKDEFTPALKFDRPGRLAMANIGQPNTGADQFFITVAPAAYLNGQHTIFGETVEGQDVVDRIVAVRKNSEDKPLRPVRITALTFERVGPAPANDPLAPPARKKAAPKKK
jgi:peptidyl-prolyl cis-trans isomerase A (cyclophilin A)